MARLLHVLLLLPLAAVLAVLAVLALTPAQCPDSGGSVLCRAPVTQPLSVLAVIGLLLAAVGLAAVGRHGRSVLVTGVAVLLVTAGGASWM